MNLLADIILVGAVGCGLRPIIMYFGQFTFIWILISSITNLILLGNVCRPSRVLHNIIVSTAYILIHWYFYYLHLIRDHFQSYFVYIIWVKIDKITLILFLVLFIYLWAKSTICYKNIIIKTCVKVSITNITIKVISTFV